MNDIEKAVVLDLVRRACADDPKMARPILDAATQGVLEFADRQSDFGTRAAFKLICVLDAIQSPPDGKFGPFTAKEVLDCLEGCFGGTPGLRKLRERYGVPAPEGEPGDKAATPGYQDGDSA